MYGPLKKKSMSYWVPFLRFQFWFRIQTLLVQNLKFRKLHSQSLRRKSVIGLFLHWLNISGTFLKQLRLFSNWQKLENPDWLQGNTTGRIFWSENFILNRIQTEIFFCEWARFLSSAAFSVIVQNPPKLRTFCRDFQELFISLEKFILAFYPSFQQQHFR